MSPTDTQRNKEMIRRWIELTNEHDFEGLSAVWAPDCVLHVGEGLDDVRGFEAFRELLESFYVGLPDLVITVEDLIAEGNIVFVRTVSAGTHTGELLGTPATGRKVSYGGVGTYRIADGQIAEEWFNDDLFALAMQIKAE